MVKKFRIPSNSKKIRALKPGEIRYEIVQKINQNSEQ